jgi:hypothetical protein
MESLLAVHHTEVQMSGEFAATQRMLGSVQLLNQVVLHGSLEKLEAPLL